MTAVDTNILLGVNACVMIDMLFFLDIPIYRLPQEKYYAERETYIEKQMYGVDPEEIALRKAFYERNRDSAIWFRDHLEKTYR
jgi:hypothetical protein